MAIRVLRASDNERKLVEMPMMPIELDSSRNGILLLVDLGRKAPGMSQRSPIQTQGPLVACVDWMIRHTTNASALRS
jgi:hypothetical protein